jgi:hypothetical protein
LHTDSQPKHLSAQIGPSVVQVGYLQLPPYFQQIQLLALGYELDEHYIASTLVPQILNSVQLGNDLVVGILDAREQTPYLQADLPHSFERDSGGKCMR